MFMVKVFLEKNLSTKRWLQLPDLLSLIVIVIIIIVVVVIDITVTIIAIVIIIIIIIVSLYHSCNISGKAQYWWSKFCYNILGLLIVIGTSVIDIIIAKPWEGDNNGDGDWSVRNENS